MPHNLVHGRDDDDGLQSDAKRFRRHHPGGQQDGRGDYGSNNNNNNTFIEFVGDAMSRFQFRQSLSGMSGPPSGSLEYRAQVLRPYGITIIETSRYYDPISYFQTTPHNGDFHLMARLDGESIANGIADVWIDSRDSSLFLKNYRALLNCHDASYQTKLAEIHGCFLRRTGFALPAGHWRATRFWQVERRLATRIVCPNTGFGSNPSNAETPPILHAAEWPLVDHEAPACVYWIQTLGFGRDFCQLLRGVTLCLDDRITAPYLTVEFEREGEGPHGTVNRMAKTACIALYNRFVLRQKVVDIRTRGPAWDFTGSANRFVNMAHYGVTFSATRYRVWAAYPSGREDYDDDDHAGGIGMMSWRGCTVSETASGPLDNAVSVQCLKDWLNEIHRWAVQIHAPSCGRDINRWLQRVEPGVFIKEEGRPCRRGHRGRGGRRR